MCSTTAGGGYYIQEQMSFNHKIKVCTAWYTLTRIGLWSHAWLHLTVYTDAATTVQPNMQRNPAYIQLGPIGAPQIFNENSAAAYDDAEPSQNQEPTYEIIPPDTIKNTSQRKQNVNCKQNPAYIHLRVHRSMEENSNWWNITMWSKSSLWNSLKPLTIKQEVLKVATINTHESSIIHNYCNNRYNHWFP